MKTSFIIITLSFCLLFSSKAQIDTSRANYDSSLYKMPYNVFIGRYERYVADPYLQLLSFEQDIALFSLTYYLSNSAKTGYGHLRLQNINRYLIKDSLKLYLHFDYRKYYDLSLGEALRQIKHDYNLTQQISCIDGGYYHEGVRYSLSYVYDNRYIFKLDTLVDGDDIKKGRIIKLNELENHFQYDLVSELVDYREELKIYNVLANRYRRLHNYKQEKKCRKIIEKILKYYGNKNY